MSSKKKDLEIIYNLQWNNSTENGGDKANIIGMYDIPSTTLNWDVFKSYLLKNSGTIGDDVKVYYVTDSLKEFPILSQSDFQVALYAFRRKARIGEIVTLKLERNSEQQNLKNQSNDAETQFDTAEGASISVSCCNADTPPEWFTTYMANFKKSISEEMTAAIASAVANIKPHTASQPACYHSRKSKQENSKRRKLPLLTGDGSHESSKDLIRSLKTEGKLEYKLEKLENKTKKLKEKKMALFSKSSDSDAGNSSLNRRQATLPLPIPAHDASLMDAMTTCVQPAVPHMLGGEIYLHQWSVMNCGQLPWTNETNLVYTWGSAALKPLDMTVPVPLLNVGETGVVSVRLQIPNEPGTYECYFHFHHRNRRFGHWLGCNVIVDKFDLKGNRCVLDAPIRGDHIGQLPGDVYHAHKFTEEHWPQPTVNESSMNRPATNTVLAANGNTALAANGNTASPVAANIASSVAASMASSVAASIASTTDVLEISYRAENLKLQDPTDTNCSTDDDNQSIISISDSNSSKGIPSEYVVVPVPKCFELDEMELSTKTHSCEKSNNGSQTLPASSPLQNVESLDSFDDNNNEEAEHNDKEAVAKDKDHSSKSDGTSYEVDYASIVIDGQTITLPKQMIRPEYLTSANEIKVPANFFENTSTTKVEASSPRAITIAAREAARANFILMGQKSMGRKWLKSEMDISKAAIENGKQQTFKPKENDNTDAVKCYDVNSGSSLDKYKELLPENIPESERLIPKCYRDKYSTKKDAFYSNSCEYRKNKVKSDTDKSKTASENGSQQTLVPKGNDNTELINLIKNKTQPANAEENDFASHCATAGSCYSEPHAENDSRLFMFPRAYPGFEVVQGTDIVNVDPAIPEYTWSNSNTQYAFAGDFNEPFVVSPVITAPNSKSTETENNTITHVPNYQQTPPENRYAPSEKEIRATFEATEATCENVGVEPVRVITEPSAPAAERQAETGIPVVHILPESLVTGVTSAVTSVARSVMNRISSQGAPGRWVDGHWVCTDPNSPREANLQALAEMGFWNRDLNATLLARYNDDLSRVVAELVQ